MLRAKCLWRACAKPGGRCGLALALVVLLLTECNSWREIACSFNLDLLLVNEAGRDLRVDVMHDEPDTWVTAVHTYNIPADGSLTHRVHFRWTESGTVCACCGFHDMVVNAYSGDSLFSTDTTKFSPRYRARSSTGEFPLQHDTLIFRQE